MKRRHARAIRAGILTAQQWGLRPTPLDELYSRRTSSRLTDRAWSRTHRTLSARHARQEAA